MVALAAFPASILLSLLPLFPALTAQSFDNSTSGNIMQDLTSFLQDCGYNSLSNLLSQASDLNWTSGLSEGSWTVFAPTDQAFSRVLPEFSGNATLFAEHLSYHFVFGNQQNTSTSVSQPGGEPMTSSYPASQTDGYGDGTATSTSYSEPTSSTEAQYTTQQAGVRFWKRSWNPFLRREGYGGAQLLSGIWPNVTLGRTLLNASDLVQLEGGKSQVLAWTRSGGDGDVTVLNQAVNVTVGNGITWRNFFIVEIDGVLIPPGNVTTALTATNQSTLLNLGNHLYVPSANGTNVTAIEFLDEAEGFTIFAPSDEAFAYEGGSILQQLQGNQTALADAIRNHFINGTTFYSPNLKELAAGTYNYSQQTIYSAGGEPFTFTNNQTGLFVSNGNGTEARVVRPDVLVRNGVIHIIDRILVNTNSDPSAASAAFDSASAVATETSTDTQAVGISPIAAGTMTPPGEGSGQSTVTQTTTDSGYSTSTATESYSDAQSTTTEYSTGGGGEPQSTVYVTVTARSPSFRFRRGLSLRGVGL